jgi:hypothetical protein
MTSAPGFSSQNLRAHDGRPLQKSCLVIPDKVSTTEFTKRITREVSMKKIMTAFAFLAFPLFCQAADWETRCGWLENPTPANFWLNDKDGSWTISEQGGYSAKGVDNISLTRGDEWVVTNVGDYGFGCACAQVKTDPAAKRVLEIKSVGQKLLKVCLQDMALPNSMSCK